MKPDIFTPWSLDARYEAPSGLRVCLYMADFGAHVPHNKRTWFRLCVRTGINAPETIGLLYTTRALALEQTKHVFDKRHGKTVSR